jgi:hypothetical protein
MPIMEYNLFKQIFNETIFEKSKADLLEKIAGSPYRYIGLFRPTKPKAKILQNLLQSHEIRFGDAFEHIIEKYFLLKGCETLPKRIKIEASDVLNVDQCFRKDGNVYFIEQKIRDDHDSTKKRGQIDNFEKKLGVLLSNYAEEELIGIFYFLDPDFMKNRNFYSTELSLISRDYNVETHLFYGKHLFDYLGFEDIWDEILQYLAQWKIEIPELPEINFDFDAQHTFEEIKNLKPLVFRKLFSNDDIFSEILLTIFPQRSTLNLLLNHFNERSLNNKIFHTLHEMLNDKLNAL